MNARNSFIPSSALNLFRKYTDALLPLDEKDWKVFSSLFSESVLKKGDYFAREGVVQHQLAFLVDGIVRAFYRNKDGYEYNKKFFLTSELIAAYSSLISKQPSRINVQALADCRILVADFDSIVTLFDQHPMLERIFRKKSESLYLYKEKRELELVCLQADERYQLFKEEYPTLEGHIPQYHIASYLGITPTQLSRIRARKKN
jgi:CRP-like cAMP-binding protein